MAQVEPPEERTKMKLTLAAVLVLSLCVSPALSQQQAASSAVPLTATLGPQPLTTTVGQQPTSSALFAAVTATIRVFGSPTAQPTRGLGIECTPVEQSIVGVIIGPTDLCDR
jgi:formate-dependent phosphoribosylglycinamide formyltransferase (GAR transformylase)